VDLSSSPKIPSERSFGLLFTAVFAGLGALRLWKGAHSAAWFAAAAAVAIVTFAAPRWLLPFNRAWFLLGQGLNKIVSPLVLGLLFFCLLTPLALLARLFGRDELRLKRRGLASYWLDRVPPGPAADSFKHPF
jgi:hypothetical protein